MSELPSGTVTFLFTDIEGSTRLWQSYPDVMRGVLARHDELVRAAIENRGGYVVKTTGDGYHAAFADPAAAVAAAIDAEQSIGAEAWELPDGLWVRIGIHSGPAELRDGDYYGTAVNKAARLMSVAHGGQIVVSLATEELVRDDLPDAAEVIDLGEQQLRDVARPERVFQVSAPGVDRDFPPLESGTGVPGNLPVISSTFVGREEDVAGAARLLDEATLVTLIGVGGVGKTRLALRIASETAGRYADGTWFCDLASVSDAEGVGLSIATTLGMPARPGRRFDAALLDFLRAKELLLVLDNCEHLVAAVASLAVSLVRSCPRLRTLATSREALGVDGERLWPVRPLPVPEESSDLHDALANPTVQLLVDRVRALRPEFRLDRDNVAPVVEICRRLDGIPLALELAAARVRSLSPADVAARLDRRFAILSGGRRRGVARHETLRAAVDWSYDLLDRDEQSALQRLCVFVGGITIPAAEAVADDDDLERDVLDVVTSLVDKSMLVVDEHDGSARYRLLETIRQYAVERLEESGTADHIRNRHLIYFTKFAEEAAVGLTSSEEPHWWLATRAELDNIRAASAWAVETGNADDILRVATALVSQINLHPSWGLGTLSYKALDAPGIVGHPLYPIALAAAGDHEYRLGNLDRAAALVRQALERVASDDDANADRARFLAEGLLGRIAMMDARDDPAAHYERALELARRVGTASDIAWTHGLLSMALPARGADHLDRALEEARAALRDARASGSPSAIGVAQQSLGYVLVLRGDPAAGDVLREGLRKFSVDSESGRLSMLAMHEMRFGTRAQAANALADTIRRARFEGDATILANAIDIAFPFFAQCGDPTTSIELLGALEQGPLPHLIRAGVPGDKRARAVTRIEAQLTPEEVDAARQRGASMTVDEVLDRALMRIDELTANFD